MLLKQRLDPKAMRGGSKFRLIQVNNGRASDIISGNLNCHHAREACENQVPHTGLTNQVTASLPAATLLRSALPCDPSWALSPLPDFCPSLPLVSSVSVFGFWVTAENSPWKCDRKRGTLERMNINDLQKDCNAAVNSAAHRLASGTNPILCPRHWEL